MNTSIILSIAFLGGMMASAQNAKLDRFKDQIGIDAVSRNVNSTDRVILNLQDLTNCPELGTTWTVKDERLNLAAIGSGSGVNKEIYYQRNGEKLSVNYYCFNDIESAKNTMLGIANSAELPIVPYAKGQKDIGDLSLIGLDSLVFWKANVCVRLRRQNSNVDLNTIARWIQSHFENCQRAETSRKAPQSTRPTVSYLPKGEKQEKTLSSRGPISLLVGESVAISAQLPERTRGNNPIVKEWFDRKHLNVVMQGDKWLVTPKMAGSSVFKYVLIDPTTLLSSTIEIQLDAK